MSDLSPVELYSTTIGSGPQAVVWCHGVFGQGKNFTRVAKDLVAGDPDRWRCILLDLPDHGRSPWTDEISYPRMAASVAAMIERLSPDRPVHLLGHSMGGKVAMRTALDRPELLSSLVVVDMAPVVSPLNLRFDPLTRAMRSLDLSRLRTRAEAEAQLSVGVPDRAVRQFLLQNLRHDVHAAPGHQWHWQMNLELLDAQISRIADWPDTGRRSWGGPTLWISGEDSDYVHDSYQPAMSALFPLVRRVRVKHSGHWVHSDQPETFVRVLRSFLQQI
ncbi:alpha/beta fold hydrolase [Acidipropionibacterium virtanenii]|uniref:Esterase YbfF n=1 Tax=Acidipropionibacterium virtanenii TaxID=2057246 RepID=A0A344UTW5_9ACTN|nr:alpha/beta fold hydrolase [Acidipropionibacterium virtanenii]AXE38713.1 Esterase YbfF [Acidipropionibacterium virtanenii]